MTKHLRKTLQSTCSIINRWQANNRNHLLTQLSKSTHLFKSVKTISYLARKQFKLVCIYLEKKTCKSSLDGLGGAIKSLVNQTVTREKILITNALEFYTILLRERNT